MNGTYFRTIKTGAHGAAAKRWERTEPRGEIRGFVPSETLVPEMVRCETSEEKEAAVYGCVYQQGAQCLDVNVPGDLAPVRFSGHSILSGMRHDEDAADVVADAAGVYEIRYSALLRAEKAVYAAVMLQADGETIEGSLTGRLTQPQGCAYDASVIAELKDGAALRLVATSGSVASLELAGSGVTAYMLVRRLG